MHSPLPYQGPSEVTRTLTARAGRHEAMTNAAELTAAGGLHGETAQYDGTARYPSRACTTWRRFAVRTSMLRQAPSAPRFEGS
jgi:hypothetical protein